MQVFKQQADAVKLEHQQRRHAAKLQAGQRDINLQLQKEEQNHQRVVAARKVWHTCCAMMCHIILSRWLCVALMMSMVD